MQDGQKVVSLDWYRDKKQRKNTHRYDNPSAVLQDELKKQGIQQNQLAVELNVSESTLSRYINGSRKATCEIIAEAALAINSKPLALMHQCKAMRMLEPLLDPYGAAANQSKEA